MCKNSERVVKGLQYTTVPQRIQEYALSPAFVYLCAADGRRLSAAQSKPFHGSAYGLQGHRFSCLPSMSKQIIRRCCGLGEKRGDLQWDSRDNQWSA